MSHLRMTRGDDRVFTIDITDSAGAAVDLSGASIAFSARRGLLEDPIITKSTGSGIATTEVTGEAELTIDAEDTADLPLHVPTDLLWDVQVIDDAGVIQTAVAGTLRIVPDVTRVVTS